MAAAAGVDTLLDGMVIGASYAIDPELGSLLAIGLGIDLAAVTSSTAIEFREAGTGRGVTAMIVTGISLMLAVGATGGILLFSGASDRLHAFALSIATSALLYLVADELLAHGRDARDSTGTAACLFFGFVSLASYTVWAS